MTWEYLQSNSGAWADRLNNINLMIFVVLRTRWLTLGIFNVICGFCLLGKRG